MLIRNQLFTLLQIRIHLSKIMRIRIRDPYFFRDLFGLPWDRFPNPDPDRLTQQNSEARIRIRHTVYMDQ
jgi:hypothetical protein